MLRSGGGSDTTAIALAATFFYLLKNETALRKLRAEIDEFDANGKLSTPAKYNETLQMPYLQAVLKESMRIHPSVAFIYPRYVPKGGVTLAGRYIPEGVSPIFPKIQTVI